MVTLGVQLVSATALIEGLKSGRIGAAGADCRAAGERREAGMRMDYRDRWELKDYLAGQTLGEAAEKEPTYIDWIASTITRDRDLVMRAKVIASDLDARGVERRPRVAEA